MKENQLTVGILIEFLGALDPNMPVCFEQFSERCLLSLEQIEVITACIPRPDGWIQNERWDMDSREYLCFPGN